MSRPKPRRAVRSAGVFLGPSILPPASLRTLCDEYRDEPTYPDDEHEPEPERPGLVRRVIDRLARRPNPGR
jgi:hypothetical protein